MRKHKVRSNKKAKTSKKAKASKKAKPSGPTDLLLESRAAMLGLDLGTAECCDRKTFKKLMRRCRKCDFRKACAADLKHDPYDTVWRTYCRNSEVLMKLAMAWWPRVYPGTWGGMTKVTEHELD